MFDAIIKNTLDNFTLLGAYVYIADTQDEATAMLEKVYEHFLSRQLRVVRYTRDRLDCEGCMWKFIGRPRMYSQVRGWTFDHIFVDTPLDQEETFELQCRLRDNTGQYHDQR